MLIRTRIFSIIMKTLMFISLHLLIGLLTGPYVVAQEQIEMPATNGSDATYGLPVDNHTVPADTTLSSASTVTTTQPNTLQTSASTPLTTQLSSASSVLTTTTTTTREESRVSLMQIPEFRGLLQSVLRILSDEFGTATIPGGLTDRSQVIRTAMQNVNLMRIVKRVISQEDIRHTFPKPEVVSQRCYDDVVDFVDGLIGQRIDANSKDYNTTTWALIMMDAFGKPASGYLPGTLQWVGNYDECYGVHATIQAGAYLGSRPTAREKSSEFYPRYCRVQMLIPSILATMDDNRVHGYWEYTARLPSLLHWGMCLPESCEQQEVETLIKQVIQLTAAPLTVWNAVCFERDRDLGSDAGAIFAICLLSVVGAVIVVCTIVESAIFYGFLPWCTDKHGSNSNHPPTSSTETPPMSYSSNGAGSGIDTPIGKDTYHDLHGGKHMEKNVTNPPTASPRTPLTRDVRPKDVLGNDTQSSRRLEGKPESDAQTRKSNIGVKLLQAFSIRYNGSKILATSTESNPGMLASIQGIRSLSILWIVLGHTYTIGGTMDVRHIMFSVVQRIQKTAGRLTFTFVAAADLGVDTFFLIGGVLVMLMTLREVRRGKGQGIGFWLMFILHRIWRLTPVYMMVLMTGTTLYEYLIDGPLKSEPYMMFEHCESHWWTNLLFINNIIKPLEMCMPWSWYLAVDFQLFALAPIFINLVHKKYRLGLLALVLATILGTVLTFVAVMNNPGQMLTMFTDDRDFFKHVYVASYTRMPAFFIGMLTAVALEDIGDNLRLSKLKSFVIWTVLTASALFLIMIPHEQWKDEGDLWPKGTQAVYESLKRPVWSFFIAWIIFTCQTGRGGILGDFLKWKGFQPMARLAYTVYLVHPMIITFFMYERNLPIDLEDGVMIYRFFGNAIMSFLFAAVFTLLFESPLMALEKIVLHKK